MSVAGKRAFVTGGGRGIGAAIAKALAAAGAKVIVHGRSGAVDVKADLTDRAATDRMLAEVGAVDILVNNAGAAESAPLDKTTDAMCDRIVELDATAPFRITRALVPAMIAAKWGRVIHIAS